jgi:hypothetical protein
MWVNFKTKYIDQAFFDKIETYTAPATPPATNDLVICIRKTVKHN